VATLEKEFEGPGESPPGDTAVLTQDPGPVAKTVRTLGELLITAGLVVLLFVVYELYVTDLFSAGKQADASSTLDNQWAKDQRTLHPELIDGQAFARLYIPSFGADYHFTVQEGVDEKSLAVGPGHYKGTALPGEPGNVGIAGHRVSNGAPFNDLDQLTSCNAIVLETQTAFFLYRVLPHDEEMAGWATGKGAQPQCKGVSTLRDPNLPNGGPYGQTTGRKIVLPTRGDAVSPVPYKAADILPVASRASLLTMTTCNPQFSARERLVVQSVLVKQWEKSPGSGYQDVLKEIGDNT
jgi:sortase A